MAKKKRGPQEKHEVLTKTWPEGVLITDERGTLTYVNPALEEMFGVPSSTSVGTHFRDYITPASARTADALFLACTQGKTVRDIELEAVHQDRHVFAIEIAASPILRGGKFQGVESVVRNITERKHIEEALRRSERQFRSTFENAAIGIAHTSLDGHILQVNSRFCEIAGYPCEELVGRTCAQITLAEDWEAEQELLRCLLEGEITHYSIEKRYRRRDGSLIWVYLTRSLERDDAGRAECFLIFAADISQHKQAEEALHASEQRFRSVVENSLDVAYRRDLRNNRYDYISPVVEQTTGFGPEEMNEFTNDDLLARMHPDDRDRVIHEFNQAMESGVGTIEYRFLCKDSTYHWFADYFVVQKDEAGRPLYVSGSMRDSTGLKQTEAALRSSERRFRKLFEASLAGVYLTKPDGTILDFNDSMMRMLGYDTREEVYQHRSTDFYVDPEFRRKLVYLLQKDGIVPAMEAVLQRKDGSILHALGHAVLLRNDETGEPYIQGMAIDITERKQAEEALRELTRTLESKVAQRTAELERRARQLEKMALELSETEDRERRRLAEILHDDLQQELAAAKFQIQLIRSQARTDSSLQAILTQVEHMLKDAIGKSRSLSHELSPAVMHHDDFAETLRCLADEVETRHGLVVHVQATGEVRTESEAIKSLLYRAARELLFNAVKHARATEAHIRVRQYGRCIGLLVSDRGRGFDPHKLEEAAGFGLLSIRERVELLKGRMKIRSAPGQGSRFLIVIPAGERIDD